MVGCGYSKFGKTINDFNESKGDYMKIQVFLGESSDPISTLFSNRLLLKHSELDTYHLGPYHFHPENSSMGFCTGTGPKV